MRICLARANLPTLGTVRNTIVSGLSARSGLVGDGVLEEYEDDTLLEEVER